MESNEQPNLFLILELDPDQPWSQADFERQLQKKRHEWARLVNFATEKGIKAKTQLALIPKLKEIAQDEAQRKAQADAARKARAEGESSKLQQFSTRLKLLEVRGFIVEDELNQLIKEFAGTLSPEQIRKAVKVPVKKVEETGRQAHPTLEPSKAKDIQRKLDGLGKASLYDFLGMSQATENRLLVQRAKDLYDGVQRKAAKTPQDTLTSELSGHCLALFGNTAERAKYDEALRLQAFEAIKTNADTMAGALKQLEGKQVEELLRQARENGLDVKEALAILKEHAAKKYALILPENLTDVIQKLQLCGHCGRLSDSDKAHCTKCGKPLKVPCPKCSQPVPSADRACGKCGFLTGNAPWTDSLITEAKTAAGQKDYELSAKRLTEALDAWPAPEKDARVQQIRTLEAQIKHERANQNKLMKALEELIKQRRFYQARKQLPQMRNVFAAGDAQLTALEQAIEQALKRAEAAYTRIGADVSTSNDGAQLRSYQNVLELCADYDDGNLAQRVRTLEARIKQGEQGKAKLVNELKTAQRERCYFAAYDLLVKIKHDYGATDLVSVEADIAAKIREVQQLIAQARTEVGRNEEKVVQFCTQALQICQDATDAKMLLMQLPPTPPTNLQAILRGDVVQLTWNESTSTGTHYLVIRKQHSRPLAATDGEVIAKVADTRYDDKSLEVGLPTFYAIFADRGGVRSARAAVLTKPVMRIQQVRNVSKVVEDRRIYLKWEPPPHVHKVIVRGSEVAYPEDINAGREIFVVNQCEASDTQLENGRTYFYSIFSSFRDYDGSVRITAPVRIEALAQAPPPPITDLKLSVSSSSTQRQICLQWTPPAQGDVVILHTQQDVNLRFGQSLPRQDLENYGRVLATRGNELTLPIEAVGTHAFYPVVVVQGTSYVGQRQEYFCLSDVTDVQVEDLGLSLRICWDWPPNCKEVELVYSHLEWPDQASDVTMIVVSKDQYDPTGYYELVTSKRLDYYLWVRTVVEQEGKRLRPESSTNGSRTFVERPNHLVIEYTVEKSWRLFSPARLTLQISLRKGAGKIPGLVLVSKQGEPPAYKQDGVIILQLKAQLLEDTTSLVYDLTMYKQENAYARLFLENDRLYEFIEMRHPAPQQLRLF